MRERPHKYIPGDHWAICDECGLKYRRSEIRKRWDGAMVCKKDWEPKHPQENVRVRVDRIKVDHARPEGDGGNLLAATPTLGQGWTDNGNNTYTSDGSDPGGSSVIWPVPDMSAYYEIIIVVTDGGADGTVFGFCGTLETDRITTGMTSKYGGTGGAEPQMGLSQAYAWTGTVRISINRATLQDDL